MSIVYIAHLKIRPINPVPKPPYIPGRIIVVDPTIIVDPWIHFKFGIRVRTVKVWT